VRGNSLGTRHLALWCCCSSVVEHSLGKGEAVSSILTSSISIVGALHDKTPPPGGDGAVLPEGLLQTPQDLRRHWWHARALSPLRPG
jgi:hypothetical protein